MGFNRYSSPAQFQAQNTYVPIPFDELLTAGMLRDKQYYENQAAKDAFYTGLRDMDVHAADQPLYQRKIGELNDQLQDILKSNPDIGSYDFKRSLDNVISAQTRDPLWRMMKYNLPKATELEKAYARAKAEGNTPANLSEIEDLLKNFHEKGSEGVGFLGDASPYKYVDYAKPLEERGQGFIKEGGYQGLYNPDFTVKTTTSTEQIPINEVAAVYGYKVDPRTRSIQFVGIPHDFLNSDAGNQLQREARYIAKNTGQNVGEVLNGLYQEKAAPLVFKYSGGTSKYDMDVTSLGLKKMEDKLPNDQSVYTVPSKPLPDDRNVEGKVPGIEPTGAGKFLRTLTEGVAYPFLWDEKRVKEITADLFGDKPRSNPDFDAVRRNILNANPGLGNNPRELQNAIEDYFDGFFKKAVEMPVRIEQLPKEKERQAKIWFGGAADSGKIEADKLSGAGVNQKIFNPEDPTETSTLGEIAKKANTIEYIGPLKNNNLYKAGLHEIIVDGKSYYMLGTNQERLANEFDWSLYDYNRHPSGIGNWIQPEGTNKEVRSVKWVNSKGQEEVFLQYKPAGASDNKAKSTQAVPVGTDMFNFYKTQVAPVISK